MQSGTRAPTAILTLTSVVRIRASMTAHVQTLERPVPLQVHELTPATTSATVGPLAIMDITVTRTQTTVSQIPARMVPPAPMREQIISHALVTIITGDICARSHPACKVHYQGGARRQVVHLVVVAISRRWTTPAVKHAPLVSLGWTLGSAIITVEPTHRPTAKELHVSPASQDRLCRMGFACRPRIYATSQCT